MVTTMKHAGAKYWKVYTDCIMVHVFVTRVLMYYNSWNEQYKSHVFSVFICTINK